MKIFSNFDTQLDDRLYKDAISKFGQDKVLFVRRDKIYLVLKIWLKVGFWFLFSVIALLLYYLFLGGETGVGSFIGGLLWLLVGLTGLWIGYVVIKKLIDYYMDYTIITPQQITQYDQGGILNRYTRSLDIYKVKSISIDKKGLLRSIFNYGSIIFFSEGDSNKHGDITLNYISNPNLLRDSIQEIVDLSEKMKVLLEQEKNT